MLRICLLEDNATDIAQAAEVFKELGADMEIELILVARTGDGTSDAIRKTCKSVFNKIEVYEVPEVPEQNDIDSNVKKIIEYLKANKYDLRLIDVKLDPFDNFPIDRGHIERCWNGLDIMIRVLDYEFEKYGAPYGETRIYSDMSRAAPEYIRQTMSPINELHQRNNVQLYIQRAIGTIFVDKNKEGFKEEIRRRLNIARENRASFIRLLSEAFRPLEFLSDQRKAALIDSDQYWNKLRNATSIAAYGFMYLTHKEPYSPNVDDAKKACEAIERALNQRSNWSKQRTIDRIRNYIDWFEGIHINGENPFEGNIDCITNFKRSFRLGVNDSDTSPKSVIINAINRAKKCDGVRREVNYILDDNSLQHANGKSFYCDTIMIEEAMMYLLWSAGKRTDNVHVEFANNENSNILELKIEYSGSFTNESMNPFGRTGTKMPRVKDILDMYADWFLTATFSDGEKKVDILKGRSEDCTSNGKILHNLLFHIPEQIQRRCG